MIHCRKRSRPYTTESGSETPFGKLPLPEEPARYIPRIREAHGIGALPIDEADALHLARLPQIHKDPFDRLLVSQAICRGLTILTPDPLIHTYPARWEW